MSYTDAENGLIQHIMSIPGRPAIYYPDGQDVGLPRWNVQVAANAGRPITYSGTSRAMTELVVKVETEDGGFADQNGKLVEMLCQAFKVNQDINTPSGRILRVMGAPEPRAPLSGGGIYARPVIIRARHFF